MQNNDKSPFPFGLGLFFCPDAPAVAAFDMKQKNFPSVGRYNYCDIMELARKGKGEDAPGDRAEFILLVKLTNTMQTVSR